MSKDMIEANYKSIARVLGVDINTTTDLTDEQGTRLGRWLNSYMIESMYDSDWEGFSDEELGGVEALIQDLRIYVETDDLNQRAMKS